MHQFSKNDLTEGKKFVDDKQVVGIVFSEGTYQIEVLPSRKSKEALFPFMQLTDSGDVVDAFCTCKIAEGKGSCTHLAAGYLAIMDKEPLHVRFRESLWNQIGKILATRLGYDVKCLKETKEGYEGLSRDKERVFFLKKGDKHVEKILFDRPVETEETSLKFSNLPQEEIALWRQGKPSDNLRYELSFWSDLAKWWMAQEEYTIHFSSETPPRCLEVKFPKSSFSFIIEEKDWEKIIPSLKGIHSPLKVHLNGVISDVFFSEEKGVISLEFEGEGTKTPSEEGIELGNWLYFPGTGFFPKTTDPFLEQKTISKEKVSEFLDNYQKLAQKHLQIHLKPIALSYSLEMQKRGTLLIRAYAFARGDLQEIGAHYFGDWIYLRAKGFYKIGSQEFETPALDIPKEKLSDFIGTNRVWLYGFEGFQTHVSGVESHLGFKVDKAHLNFFTKHEFTEEQEHIKDLGDWIYVEGKGFYEKKTARPGAFVKAGMEVELAAVSHFIDEHRAELETIPKFFALACPLEKSGLHIGFNEKGQIEISPEYFFANGYDPAKVRIFGNYTYVQGEGFSLIPHASRLPDSYKTTKVVDAIQEPYFIGYELEPLYPHVLSIDSKLKKPRKLSLRLLGLKRQASAKTGQWVLEMLYESEIGQVSPFLLWEAIWTGKQYLFSDAGLIFLNTPRFNWLKQKHKKKWLDKGASLRFDTLEFFRLFAFEEVLEPQGGSRKAKSSRKLFNDFISFKAPTEIQLEGLKSQLRPYQRTGVAWLWFLHSYGLSGLLCDEMGLGKTHQAMALMAGIKNVQENKKPKFLVVCPTSVIYHWEKLIQNFLPNFKAYVFHGIGRNFSTFADGSYDLLVTSYGICRTENKALSGQHFDVAIFDELQIAKNDKSLTNKALHNIKANMRLGLTGTPIENRLLELKALFDLIIPTYLPKSLKFREVFVNPIEKHGDIEKQELLSRLIHPFLLRRKKSEVLTELPEKIEEIVLCDLSADQAKLYQEVINQNRESLLKELQDTSKPPPIAHIFSLLSKLKQICDHPCLVNKDIANYKKYTSGKWELFQELLSEIRDSGQKLVVFTQYLDMLNIMGMHLKEEKIGFAEIRGSTRNRKEEVERFAEDPDCRVFLGSLQAAGVGIDLIAASVVIHYDRWWNPAKENQATDRVHRMGQKRGVQVFKLVTKDTLEEQIHTIIERKKSLATGIIGFDAEDQIKGLDRTELIELVRLLH